MRTDRTVPNNKPYNIINDDKKGTPMLIDVAFPGDRNLVKKGAENILNCTDLVIEFQRMCNVKEKVIPVETGATGTISKSLRKYLDNVTGENDIKERQKTAILGTAHILREVLTQTYKTYFTGEITLHVTQTVNTEQLQILYTLKTCFFLYIIVNIQHKSDN